MQARSKRTLICVLAAALASASCLYPHDRPNVEYGNVAFRFGINQPVELAAALRGTGTCHLYFLLRKDSLPQDGGGVPLSGWILRSTFWFSQTVIPPWTKR